MKSRLENTLKIKCEFEKFGCDYVGALSGIKKHEKDCEKQAYFCPNKGCYMRVPATELDAHLKECDYEVIPCPDCGFEIFQKERGRHDCVSQIKEYLEDNSQVTEELEEKLEDRESQITQLKDKLDEVTSENQKRILKLSQRLEQAKKKGKALEHDIRTTPDGIDHAKAQEELEQEYEAQQMSVDFSENRLNDYISSVDEQMDEYSTDIDKMLANAHQNLWAGFRSFVNKVTKKFEGQIVDECINNKFDDVSPIRSQENKSENRTLCAGVNPDRMKRERSRDKLQSNLKDTKRRLNLDEKSARVLSTDQKRKLDHLGNQIKSPAKTTNSNFKNRMKNTSTVRRDRSKVSRNEQQHKLESELKRATTTESAVKGFARYDNSVFKTSRGRNSKVLEEAKSTTRRRSSTRGKGMANVKSRYNARKHKDELTKNLLQGSRRITSRMMQ